GSCRRNRRRGGSCLVDQCHNWSGHRSLRIRDRYRWWASATPRQTPQSAVAWPETLHSVKRTPRQLVRVQMSGMLDLLHWRREPPKSSNSFPASQLQPRPRALVAQGFWFVDVRKNADLGCPRDKIAYKLQLLSCQTFEVLQSPGYIGSGSRFAVHHAIAD